MKNKGEIVGIYIQKEKGQKPELVGKAYLKEELGLTRDIHSGGGERQVSIFTEEGWNEIKDKELKGLCINKFHENIRVKNVDINNISQGSTVLIGETLHQITEIGKSCFPECNLIKQGKTCPLHQGVIFTKVLKGGEIKIGDKIFTCI
jgi:MOSC domain-containing protein YiiM